MIVDLSVSILLFKGMQMWCFYHDHFQTVLYLDTCLCISADVNFIASPPSMVAAGSVVAAVQGLYLKSQDASLSSQNLTNFLSQVIRSDPVCHSKHTTKKTQKAVVVF